ncbi:DUF1127 domain-containing protein [Mangrovicoccus algicola]|uniref:DUF1127 domain-containing protein n=1 Tax=Mangrovicoccus algicola TaxID=2771008 RepID=A0A8J6YU21_9RHOB|nr:DUF1127 domain-containing protein [Mangrovicoccus algicola]MBE3637690.1 DUF1127 domain-containing protein [Mangrovicoccus algicola]
MAAITTNTLPRTAGHGPAALIDRARAAWTRWREAETARAELYALDDRELADLGISRYDIRHMDFSKP